MQARYDLILRGGRILDPAQNRDERCDVALAEGRVAAVAPELPPGQAARELDCVGKLVTPGLIDLHGHAYWGGTMLGILPDPLCNHTGVTTFVDAGSAGADNFLGLRHFILEPARVRVLPFLHICSIGLVNQGVGELLDNRYASIEKVVRTVEAHRDVIGGLKVRLGGWISGANTEAGFAAACQARDTVGLPLMVHVGGQPLPLEAILDRLKPGDILTHAFHGHANGLLGPLGPAARPDWLEDGRSGAVIPAARAAREHGVLIDVGHGSGSFSFAVARRALEQGFPPDTISTDIYNANVNGPVFDLPTTLTKFLALGMALPEVIRCVTANSAAALAHCPRAAGIGMLQPGAPADVAVLEWEEGEFTLVDAHRQTLPTNRRLVVRYTIQGGQIVGGA
ncbi:MAG TPA: amidohydrolase/deacetylase family metallohydrolase [Chthonomonadaceae bacterium]|nr:amidohydrolase/deacetylase family metallohydrolase [Chthonomonadaceae bacterium]